MLTIFNQLANFEMYEHNDTIKTETSLHFLPYLFPFPKVVSVGETR